MGFDADDQEIIRLLKKLKEAEPAYPPDLQAARRQRFLQQMGEIGLGIGAGMAAREALKNANASATSTAASTTVSTMLEIVLVAAILLEAGTVAYFYRDKVSDALKTVVSAAGVQEVTPRAQTSVSEDPLSASPSPAFTHTSALPTTTPIPPGLTVTPTLTPEPGVADTTDPVTEPAIQVQSTPRPRDNNGNHYGQTPKPERTKENNGNNGDNGNNDNNGNNGNHDQPPIEDNGPP
jgi:hypothetical protein